MNRYPGGNNSCGAYQTIISLMRPHFFYAELFAGSAAVYRHKRPALLGSWLNDKDPETVRALKELYEPHRVDLSCVDACTWLTEHSGWLAPGATIYLDPPYLPSTLKSRCRYRVDFTEAEHLQLLKLIKASSADIIISGYPSKLYDRELKGWSKATYQQTVRSGKQATEVLWYNYPKPTVLHDYRYIGKDRTTRQFIRRRQQRWLRQLEQMDPLRRNAMLARIREKYDR